jgi:hypothetical protein
MRRRTLLLGGAALLIGGGWLAYEFTSMGSSKEYAAGAALPRQPLAPDAGLRQAVRYATLAANGHNTQPWRFRVTGNSVTILPDPSRRTPVVDPDDHHLYASLGCAAENLLLAAAAIGLHGVSRFDPASDGAVILEFDSGVPVQSPLFAAIPVRQSTRAEYDGRSVSTADLAAIVTAARIPGVNLVLITDVERRNRVRDLVIAGNSAQIADPAFVTELKQWIRFNPRAALAAGDGLYAGSSGNPSLPDWLGPPMFDLTFTAAVENEKYARQVDSSTGVAIFFGERDDRDHWVRVGRACQRAALQATALGLKQSFINQPVEVPGLRSQLASLVGTPGQRPNIVMRFGYGPALPMSPRRPVEKVLV